MGGLGGASEVTEEVKLLNIALPNQWLRAFDWRSTTLLRVQCCERSSKYE